MWQSRAFFFFLGIATPVLLKQFRPLAKAVIKGGLVAADQVQKLVVEARENLEDLKAEATAELAAASADTADAPSGGSGKAQA